MSVLVVGLSHRTAPLDLLERMALDSDGAAALANTLQTGQHVSETLVLATCNRLEVVLDAGTFHGALAEVVDALTALGGLSYPELTQHLYVHHDERAVSHLFRLAGGLDSMAVGESQILGQLRAALVSAQEREHLGPVLNPLVQQALRVGKRAHSETGIDQVSRSLVGLGLERAGRVLGDLTDARTVVVGAGAMAGLAVATLVRAGVADVVVVNRTEERAAALASLHGVRAGAWADLPRLVGGADLVLTATGAVGHVLGADQIAAARAAAGRHGAPAVLLDLALPRDVDPAAAHLPGVRLWGLAELQEEGAGADAGSSEAVGAVEALVDDEVAGYLLARRADRLGPTLAALRERAARVVDAEMARLDQRLPELEVADRAEVRRTVQRVVDKLLHTPTVRVKELQGDATPTGYAQALRMLFDLDTRAATVDPDPALDLPPGVASALSGPDPTGDPA